MPLDSENYLVAQGWGGKGTALRQGSLVRPLAIPQKKTLAGVGKDRDEAFPFWDHLFSAAAKSIQLKCVDSDDEESGNGSDDPSSSSGANLKRTSTGIISNRRPITGTPADSGFNTPDPETQQALPRLSLIAAAKREAAKKGLYSRFFRGPILGPESIEEAEKRLERIVIEAMKVEDGKVRVKEHVEIEVGGERVVVDLEVEKEAGKKKKKKRKERDDSDSDDEERKERKKRRKEEKKKSKEEKKLKEEKMKLKEEKMKRKEEKRKGKEDKEDKKTKEKRKGKDDKLKSIEYDDDKISK